MTEPLVRAAHHASLVVSDMERTRAFYEGVLGLEPVERPDLGLPGAWYQAGPIQLHVIQAPAGVDCGRPPEKLTPLAPHLAFAVASYTDTLERLRAAGLPVFETHERIGQMWVADPDGNVIELIVEGARTGR